MDAEYGNGYANMTEKDLERLNKVNHPKHYTNGDIEPIDYINGNNMDYLEGNIIKYISFKGYNYFSVYFICLELIF